MKKFFTVLALMFSLALTCTNSTQAQRPGSIIRGTVIDTNEIGIEGASVIFQGSNIGTITDEFGNFVLYVQLMPNQAAQGALVISCLGYQTETVHFLIKAGIETKVRVQLKEDNIL